MEGRLSAEEEQDQHDSGEEKTGWLPGDEQQKNGDQDEEQERAGREGASGQVVCQQFLEKLAVQA